MKPYRDPRDSTDAPAAASSITRAVRLAALLLFALWVARYMHEAEPILHGSLLIFHEAGHVIFMLFGEFIMVLGGSLFQLLVPAFLVCYFVWRSDGYAACFAALYLAASFAGVGEYIADARAGELPLLGGERSNHDWTFLLIEMGMLEKDVAIGRMVERTGVLVYIAALAAGLRYAWIAPGTTPPPTPAGHARAADARRAPPASRSP